MKRASAHAVSTAAAITVAIIATVVQAEAPAGGNSAQGANATVQQPRPFGYVVGDLLTQRVLLQLEARGFEPATLPGAARLGVWLERRAPRIEATPDGRRWLAVDYQVINAPQALTTVSLPAWELKPKSGAATLRIGAWPISVSPLTPRQVFAKGGLEELRPDRPAPIIATEPTRRQIASWSGALMATLVAWFGWFLWRNWRARSILPFARALREIRQVDDTAPAAWLALHRAFDRTAGRVMQTATLATLFQRAPHFAPLRPWIEQFFNQSAELFFGTGLPASPLSVSKLCSELRRVEKRHER
jgi:mxaA protein